MIVTPTPAKTASSGWNPSQASSAASKQTSPAPRCHRQLTGITTAAPLPPPGQQESAADQPSQQQARNPPVAEWAAVQRGLIGAQQRSVRYRRKQHSADEPGDAGA